MEQVDNMKEHIGNVSRKMETLKEKKSKQNARNQKHCNK